MQTEREKDGANTSIENLNSSSIFLLSFQLNGQLIIYFIMYLFYILQVKK